MASAIVSRWPYAVIALASILGVASVFLPFTYDTSPWSAALDRQLWMLATPFFLSVAIGLASLRLLRSGVLSSVERAIALAAGAIMGSVTIWPIAQALITGDSPQGIAAWAPALPLVAAAIVGILIVVKNYKIPERRDFSAIVALQMPYIGNAAYLLIIFADSWQAGAYCAMATAVLYLVSIIMGVTRATST